MKDYLDYNQDELKKFYNNGEIYFIRYDKIEKLYMDTNGIINAKTIYRYHTNGVGLTKKNRHYIYNENELNSLIKFIEKDGTGVLRKIAD